MPTPTHQRTVIVGDGALQNAQHSDLFGPYFDDPHAEVWGMNMLFLGLHHWDRWFEVHVDYISDAPPSYRRWLKRDHGKPVYMLRKEPDIPSSVPYPLAKVTKGVSGAYFTSSRAYMIALAIYEKFDRIVVIGTRELEPERSARSTRNVAYWLGVAAGRGIEVIADPREGFMASYAGDDPHLLYGYRMRLEDAQRADEVDKAREAVEEMRRESLFVTVDSYLGR